MAQTINFDRWIMYGSGWEVSFVAQLENLTVTRAYGSDTATVSGKAWIKSVGGSTNTKAKMRIQINGTYQDVNIAGSNGSGGWYTYWAGDWYGQTFSFNVSVGASGGTLSGNVYFRTNDINSPQADSSTKSYSQTYGNKGASTISSATNVSLNTSGTATSTVKFVSYSSSFQHRLRAYCNGTWGSFTNYIDGKNSQTITQSLTFPASFIDLITTSKTATCYIYLYTYSNGSEIGNNYATITLTVPSGINPTVTINSVTKSAKVTNSFTEICTVLDAVTVSWSFTPSYSSQLNSGTVNVDGTSGSDTSRTYTSGALANYGTRSVTVTATDKRGNSGSATQTFPVYRYFYPSLSTVKFKTDNSLDIAGNIAYVNGSNVPSLVLKIYKGESTSGTTVDLGSYIGSASGEAYGESYSFNFNLPIDPQYIPDIATETYRFEVTIGDSVTTSTTTVYSAVALMTFGAGGTNIVAHKPIRYATYPEAYFDLRMRDKNGDTFNVGESTTMSNDLNDYSATGITWCRGSALNKPPNTSQYGFFMPIRAFGTDNDKFQFYFAWQDSTPVPYIRWQTNSGTWYEWAEIQTNQDSRRRVNATWKVASSSAASTEVTNRATLTKGMWVIHAKVPSMTSSVIPFRLTTVSGTTDLDSNWWNYINGNQGFTEVLRVTTDTAVVAMIIGSSTSISYSDTNRGGLRCLKV